MAMGTEPSVPMAQSTVQTTTSPAKAFFPDLAERIFSLIVWAAIPSVLHRVLDEVYARFHLCDRRAHAMERGAQAGQFRVHPATIGLRRAIHYRQEPGNFPMDLLRRG